MECLGEYEAEQALDEFTDRSGSNPFADEVGLQHALRNARDAMVNPFSLSADGKSQVNSPQPGDQLGQYKLLESVGAGGMGVVFRARHLTLDKVVAVKVLSEGRLHDPLSVARFEREMQLLARIDHANVVAATDGGVQNGIPYMVMNYVNGVDANTLVKQQGRLDVGAACEIARQAALGIEQLHTHDLIHRDIKPSNLLVGFDGLVRVVDFGVARSVGSMQHNQLTGTQQFIGTIAYMSPEQAEGRALGFSTDLFSLGATLGYLLTGRILPRFGVGRSDDLESFLPADTPPALLNIVRRLLAVDSLQRPSSARETAEHLMEFSRPEMLTQIVNEVRTCVQDPHHDPSAPSPDPNRKELHFGTTDPMHGYQSRTDSPRRLSPVITAGRWKTTLKSVTTIAAFALMAFSVAVVGSYLRFGVGTATNSVDSAAGQSGSAAESRRLDDQASRPEEPVPDATPTKIRPLPGIDGEYKERDVARWIIEQGGSLLLFPTLRVNRVEDLPREAFTVLNVNLPNAGIGDDGIELVAVLSSVKALDLTGNPLTDASLSRLTELKKLRWLYLGSTQVGDAGAEYLLSHRESLESLDLSRTQFTSTGFARLTDFPKLRELLIADTNATDAGIVGLDRFPSLLRLNLARTHITDAGLGHLKSCPSLMYLILDETKVTDQAVPHLLHLKALRQLNLQDTGISANGIRQLQEGLPDCEVLN